MPGLPGLDDENEGEQVGASEVKRYLFEEMRKIIGSSKNVTMSTEQYVSQVVLVVFSAAISLLANLSTLTNSKYIYIYTHTHTHT